MPIDLWLISRACQSRRQSPHCGRETGAAFPLERFSKRISVRSSETQKKPKHTSSKAWSQRIIRSTSQLFSAPPGMGTAHRCLRLQAARACKKVINPLPIMSIWSPKRSGWQVLKEGAGGSQLLPGTTALEKPPVAPGLKHPELLPAPCPSTTAAQTLPGWQNSVLPMLAF